MTDATQKIDDEAVRRLYIEYRKARDNDGLTHEQIAAEGWCGSSVKAFGVRYANDVASYAEALIRRDQIERLTGGEESTFMSASSERIRAGQ
jgi:hypothetical protein